MNTCMAITCMTCEEDIDCRIGYSNRRIQPLTFSCPHCDSQLGITLDISRAPASDFTYKGCKYSDKQNKGPFVGENPFIDLHLDFPVRAGEYVMGNTPFLMAMADVKKALDGDGDGQKAHEMFQFHNWHLNVLNDLCEKSDEIKRLINLYLGKNKQLFQKKAAAFLEKPENTSLLPQDVNATLYTIVSRAFLPFTVFAHSAEISEEMPKLLFSLEQAKLEAFVNQIFASNFVSNLHRDVLKVYPRILDAELPLRPALFLDLTDNNGAAKAATRISAQDFSNIKDLYKDIVEILGRQLVLVAGLNNLLHRQDANSFPKINGAALSDLVKYSTKNLSDKFKYLDNCWYKLELKAFNLELRNAIAHNNIHYSGTAQNIAYTPNGGRLEQANEQNISFLQFMRVLLIAFREMHNLNHVMKSIFYFKYLVLDKRVKARK